MAASFFRAKASYKTAAGAAKAMARELGYTIESDGAWHFLYNSKGQQSGEGHGWAEVYRWLADRYLYETGNPTPVVEGR